MLFKNLLDFCGKIGEMLGGRLSARLGKVAVSKW